MNVSYSYNNKPYTSQFRTLDKYTEGDAVTMHVDLDKPGDAQTTSADPSKIFLYVFCGGILFIIMGIRELIPFLVALVLTLKSK